MEQETFTLAELYGQMTWNFYWPWLIVWALVLLFYAGDIVVAILASRKYREYEAENNAKMMSKK